MQATTKTQHHTTHMNNNLRKLILLALTGMTLTISVQAADRILIKDTFSRGTVDAPLELADSAPDIGIEKETWQVSPSGDRFPKTTDGTSLSASFKWGQSAKLAFTPAQGNVYTLSVDVSNMSEDRWGILFGFSSNIDVDATGNLDTYAPSSLLTPNGNIQEFATAFSKIFASSVGEPSPGLTNLKIVLDTTDTQWAVSFYTNDVLVSKGVYTYETNPSISAIAIGGGDATATFHNLSLTQSAP